MRRGHWLSGRRMRSGLNMGESSKFSEKDERIYDRISPALDRFQEAHFWIHGMENAYHSAEVFRWHLNVFLKAIKEVPNLISMALQNDEGFNEWFKSIKLDLRNDVLMKTLAKNRDFVVHQGQLALDSSGSVGITELRGMKLGFTMQINPSEDSDVAMDRYLWYVAKEEDFFGFLSEDDDSLPCVERTWKIPEFEEELVDLCASAWAKTGQTLNDVIQWMGAQQLPFSLNCRHSSNRVRFMMFDRSKLRQKVKEYKKLQAAENDS